MAPKPMFYCEDCDALYESDEVDWHGGVKEGYPTCPMCGDDVAEVVTSEDETQDSTKA